jgi:hypothetical protein
MDIDRQLTDVILMRIGANPEPPHIIYNPFQDWHSCGAEVFIHRNDMQRRPLESLNSFIKSVGSMIYFLENARKNAELIKTAVENEESDTLAEKVNELPSIFGWKYE